ncbi:MAG: hypothetical protein ACRCZZ_03910, partial [Phocaeicola sp.]
MLTALDAFFDQSRHPICPTDDTPICPQKRWPIESNDNLPTHPKQPQSHPIRKRKIGRYLEPVKRYYHPKDAYVSSKRCVCF